MAETRTQSGTHTSSHIPVNATNGSVQVNSTTRYRFNQLRAPKRCIVENKRGAHRARRSQRSGDSAKCSDKSSALKDIDCDRNHRHHHHHARSVSASDQSGAIPVPQSMNLDSSPPESPPSCELTGQSLPENKRPRPEVTSHVDSLDLSTSAPASCMREAPHLITFGENRGNSPLSRSKEFTCKESLVDMQRLHYLLSRESHYHPNNAFLFYVNPDVEDKVDAALRNEAVHNLRFMHNAFFNLSTETFCKAVSLIDRFIVKVKVKPKYMACVATASYCAASKLTHLQSEDNDLPAPETLVHITRCGGNGADLIRMEEILASKLCNDLDGVNAYDFLRTFSSAIVVTEAGSKTGPGIAPTDNSSPSTNADSAAVSSILDRREHRNSAQPVVATETSTGSIPKAPEDASGTIAIPRSVKLQYNQLLKKVMTRLEIALCSLEIYRFRPACLALGILAQTGVTGLMQLATTCGIDWSEVCECASLVEELYEVYYRDPLPSSRRQMVWNLSRRTLFRIGYSSPTPLDTISEDCEPADDDEWLLPLLFEP